MHPVTAFVSAALYLGILGSLGSLVQGASAGEIGFNQSIRPVLSDNCFACHGPDANERKGKLRLDVREAALEKKAIVPGKPDESELIARIETTDEDDLMPPAESHKTLTPAQKQLLRDWIAQGAVYEGHWSYVPPVKPAVPAGQNGIDHLAAARRQAQGLEPGNIADRRTLARRLHFDLVGLPPSPEAVEAFARDDSAGAWPKLVESLLASPHFGERMAIGWLDIVRFADTIGYHSDNPRNIWPYRDYVIRAFNENKPFDRFTREQLAGDLLPDRSLETKVGSAFNRLLLSTEEGGAQPKDYEARMLTDRVRAVGTVWLGQTLGCAACHDHKFDPVTTRDFYAMGAFFADIKEPIIGRREEGLLVPDDEQQKELARHVSEVRRLEGELERQSQGLSTVFEAWEKAQLAAFEQERFWQILQPVRSQSAQGATLEAAAGQAILVKGKKPEQDTYTLEFSDLPNPLSGFRLEALPHASLPSQGSGRADNGNFVVTEMVARVLQANGDRRTLSFARARASFEQTLFAEKNPGQRWGAGAVIDRDADGKTFGWAVLPEVTRAQQLVLELVEPAKLEPGDRVEIEIRQGHGQGSHTLGHFRLAASSSYDAVRAPLTVPAQGEIAGVLRVSAGQRTAAQKETLAKHFSAIAPELEPARQALAAARKASTDYEATVARCLVSVSSDQPRTVRILPRGNFLIETGEEVEPAVPAFLAGVNGSKSAPQAGRRLTRLDLADWLVARDNPLTARVIMNRLWKQFFGVGLSKILDDLGAQGEPPPNQALLDWLACEFMDSGWNMKQMVRLIVLSDTYRQASVVPAAWRARDPLNRELAGQNSWRLEAELVRDNALAIAGLLVPKVGGPSVKPYQPDGYWENLNFPARSYESSQGQDQYRRGLYTWWQRSYVHPSMLAFDAATREECVAERNRSNIPQQALVLLNDPTFVEAARVFGARILSRPGDFATKLSWAWQQALSRTPRPEEQAEVHLLYQKHLREYRHDPSAAEALLKTGFAPVGKDLEPAELAAWTSVARVLLNLHETITRS